MTSESVANILGWIVGAAVLTMAVLQARSPGTRPFAIRLRGPVLAAALLALLRDTEAQKRQIARFHDFHHLLRQNTAEKAADAVLKVLDHGHA